MRRSKGGVSTVSLKQRDEAGDVQGSPLEGGNRFLQGRRANRVQAARRCIHRQKRNPLVGVESPGSSTRGAAVGNIAALQLECRRLAVRAVSTIGKTSGSSHRVPTALRDPIDHLLRNEYKPGVSVAGNRVAARSQLRKRVTIHAATSKERGRLLTVPPSGVRTAASGRRASSLVKDDTRPKQSLVRAAWQGNAAQADVPQKKYPHPPPPPPDSAFDREQNISVSFGTARSGTRDG